ncbi:MAG: GNAT family N-acetyltransferase [Candidatus Omnitrophica bacterium]|nr:GNAT family N-acetyltransferase [Candidatus Omnitrophota bacterium]
MKRLHFIKVSDERSIKIVASLAKEIWNEHFTPIIGRPQVEYMLEKFQSEEAIRRQIKKEQFLYYLFKKEDRYIGYAGLVPHGKKGELFLSKFYVVAGQRKKGYGRKALAFIEQTAKAMKSKKIALTVNKNNVGAMRAYRQLGFKKTAALITDIGSDFIMDDYRMEKSLG